MRRIMLTSAAVIALGGATMGARSADLPPRTPPSPLAPISTLYDWSGFYIGGFFGGTFQEVKFNEIGFGTGRVSSSDGFSGGLLSGRNFQFGNVVVGFEGDVSIQETKAQFNRGGLVPLQTDFIWNASFRGRIGYAFDRVLPFVTAGYAEADQNIHAGAGSGMNFNIGDVKRHSGYTVGGGVDYAVSDNVVVRGEYAYADYNKRNYQVGPMRVSADFDSHTIRGAIILKDAPGNGEFSFASIIPRLAMPSFSEPRNWSGVYGGAIAGYVGGDARYSVPGFGAARDNLSGIGIGTLVGASFMFPNGIVVGAEGDLSRLSTEGKDDVPGLARVDTQLLWDGHVRGRLGYAFGSVMPYVAGGFAISQAERRLLGFGVTEVDPFKGYTIGGGVEAFISERLSVRVEYLRDTYPTDNLFNGAQRYRSEISSDTIRGGFTYRLSGLNLGF